MTIECFIDRSLVEAFFNGDKAISVRSYAEPGLQELRLFTEGELKVISLEAWTVKSIYE